MDEEVKENIESIAQSLFDLKEALESIAGILDRVVAENEYGQSFIRIVDLNGQ